MHRTAFGAVRMREKDMSLSNEQKLQEHLAFIYGEEQASTLKERVMAIMNRFSKEHLEGIPREGGNEVSERDTIVIAYGDIIRQEGQPHLKTLGTFLKRHLAGRVYSIHILPFYPYSSDDGFSIIDYRAVNPALGSWKDFSELGQDFKLMVDVVLNHISRESDWFKGFLQGDPAYQDYFIVPDDSWDLSKVVRPRALPLLSTYNSVNGPVKAWTTFSDDQIDLNFANPEVLLEMLDLLLFYVSQGASIIRLDAIAYLWKQSGTGCIHLPQTHRVIKIMRLMLEMVAPYVILITETNVPHEENISYFGAISEDTGKTDEAHMVYQFPLAPLVLHTLQVGSSSRINDWVASLEPVGIFFNFIASHDGIGVLPAIGILDDREIEGIIARVHENGGLVSNRSNPDGSLTVYELNTTLFDALNDPKNPDPEHDIARFIASQVILLSLAGIPGIYYHSLFGSHNSMEMVRQTGRSRSINREKFEINTLEAMLSDPSNIHAQIFDQYRKLLKIRTRQPAFHPRGGQRVVRVSDEVFVLERESVDRSSAVLVLVNVTEKSLPITLNLQGICLDQAIGVEDLISGERLQVIDNNLALELKPYQSLWLISR